MRTVSRFPFPLSGTSGHGMCRRVVVAENLPRTSSDSRTGGYRLTERFFNSHGLWASALRNTNRARVYSFRFKQSFNAAGAPCDGVGGQCHGSSLYLHELLVNDALLTDESPAEAVSFRDLG